MWIKEEVVPIPLSKNKLSGCSHSPETLALCMLTVVALIFFCLVTANFRCCSPLKLCSGCVIREIPMEKSCGFSVSRSDLEGSPIHNVF